MPRVTNCPRLQCQPLLALGTAPSVSLRLHPGEVQDKLPTLPGVLPEGPPELFEPI